MKPRLTLFFFVALGALPHLVFSQENPKLVVAIVIDQFRYDYLERFETFYLPATKTSGGFKRLMKNGTLFTNANYTYSNTYTAPGHETFLSGVNLNRSGIIANEWFDRRINRTVYCAEDTTAYGVGTDSMRNEGRRSPRNAFVETVGDRFKTVSPTSKIIGVAIKDRGAILPAGKKADAAFWFDAESGNWISSSYYFPNRVLPAWVSMFNERKLPESYFGKPWTKLLPEKNYTMPDDAPGEMTMLGEVAPVFPHSLVDLSKLKDPRFSRNKRFDALPTTPFGNDLTIEFAQAAITAEQLGQRGVTDIFTLSFSSPDYCGHTFGNLSQEQMDMIVRLDRQLDGFFKFLDKTVGFKNCLFVLTADHGVCPIPEQVPGGLRISETAFLDSLRTFVGATYPNVIKRFQNDQVYLHLDTIAARGYQLQEVEKEIGMQAMRLTGIAGYYTRTEIQGSRDLLDSIGIKVANAFRPELSGDVFLIVKPYCLLTYWVTGTTHGTVHSYDTHVPILFCGSRIRKNRRVARAVAPIDIAPTLHEMLQIPSANNLYDGTSLTGDLQK
jgi:hypothetical protein